jgi:glycosyltransferase involved in cell wall biosynthesis
MDMRIHDGACTLPSGQADLMFAQGGIIGRGLGNCPPAATPHRMKLAYLLSEYPTLEHTYLLREVRELRALGWEIQTISIRRPHGRISEFSPIERDEWATTSYVLGSSPMEFLWAHAVTFATRPLRYLHGLVTAWRFGRCHPRLTALATAYFIEAVLAGYRLQKAGIAHVHSHFSSTVALILCRVFDVSVSMTFHGSAEFVDPEGFRLGEKVSAARFVTSISYFGRSQIMLWSPPHHWHKVEVTPLGVEATGWQPAPFRERPAPFELISVGRLAAAKGYPLLIDAVASLVAQRRDVRLTLVGDGPERAELEEHARQCAVADRVIFAGWRSQSELRELYRKSDLCVLSSFAEGVPVVLMEAMGLGIPCVAPRITGIPELVRDGIDGILFTSSDSEELACAIGRLIGDPELRRQMAKSCRERITEKYDLGKNILHLSKVFSRWISHNDAASPVSH